MSGSLTPLFREGFSTVYVSNRFRTRGLRVDPEVTGRRVCEWWVSLQVCPTCLRTPGSWVDKKRKETLPEVGIPVVILGEE